MSWSPLPSRSDTFFEHAPHSHAVVKVLRRHKNLDNGVGVRHMWEQKRHNGVGVVHVMITTTTPLGHFVWTCASLSSRCEAFGVTQKPWQRRGSEAHVGIKTTKRRGSGACHGHHYHAVQTLCSNMCLTPKPLWRFCGHAKTLTTAWEWGTYGNKNAKTAWE